MVKVRYIKADPIADLIVHYLSRDDVGTEAAISDLEALGKLYGIPVVRHKEFYNMADSGRNTNDDMVADLMSGGSGKTFRERRAEVMANYKRVKAEQAKKATDDIVPDGSFDLNEFLSEEFRIRAEEVAILPYVEEFRLTPTEATDDIWVIRNEAGEEVGRVTDGESVTFEKAGKYTVKPEKRPVDSGRTQANATDDSWKEPTKAPTGPSGVSKKQAYIRMFISDDDRDDGESLLGGVGYLDRVTGRYTVNPTKDRATGVIHGDIRQNSVGATDGLADHIVTPRVEQLGRTPIDSQFWQRAKEATDADGKCLYSFGIHIDPSTGQPHRNDHICNRQCHLLAKKAQLERNLAAAQERERAARQELVNAERSRLNQKKKLDFILDELRKR